LGTLNRRGYLGNIQRLIAESFRPGNQGGGEVIS